MNIIISAPPHQIQQSNQDLEKEVDINLQPNPCSTTTISFETSTADSQTVDVVNESMIELEKKANETVGLFDFIEYNSLIL